jgi:lysophospholipid acyltransferase (LPLAT)-like uncharacterized protein
LLRVLPWFGSWLIRFLGWSMRWEYQGLEILNNRTNLKEKVIFAFWHGRQLMMPIAQRRLNKGRKLAMLISTHRDGEYISRTISRLGIDSVRGSTYKGAVKGFKQLLRVHNSGIDVGITPDGPRGPKYKAQLGVVQLAKLSGSPVLPVTFGALKKKLFPAGMA